MSDRVAALRPPLRVALHEHDPRLGLREETTQDAGFIRSLYADTRHDELAPLPWPEQAKRDFLDAQCALQADHYRRHYVGAEFSVIESTDVPIGRLYVHATPLEIRVMDIALLKAWTGQGIGSVLISAVQRIAAGSGRSVTLHVEPDNPAQRLYGRLGFKLVEKRGVYDFLGWNAPR